MSLSDEQLIQRAEAAGWEWKVNATGWFSFGSPCTGWLGHGFSSGTEETKASMLRRDGKDSNFGFDHDYDCQHCKKPIWLSWLKPTSKQLIDALECFGCNHFMKLHRGKDDSCVVIEREDKRFHYMVGTNTTPSRMNGFGGQKFIIHFLDGRTVETVDLWHQGTIPVHLYQFFPVNARFGK